MRHLIPLLALLLTGCASLGLDWEDGTLMTRTGAMERRLQKVQAEQAVWRIQHREEIGEQDPNFVIQAGLSVDQIKKQFGKPEITEMRDGVLSMGITANGAPTIFRFKDDKLVEWGMDRQEQGRRIAVARDDQERFEQVRAAQNAARAQGAQNWIESSRRSSEAQAQRNHEEQMQSQQMLVRPQRERINIRCTSQRMGDQVNTDCR